MARRIGNAAARFSRRSATTSPGSRAPFAADPAKRRSPPNMPQLLAPGQAQVGVIVARGLHGVVLHGCGFLALLVSQPNPGSGPPVAGTCRSWLHGWPVRPSCTDDRPVARTTCRLPRAAESGVPQASSSRPAPILREVHRVSRHSSTDFCRIRRHEDRAESIQDERRAGAPRIAAQI